MKVTYLLSIVSLCLMAGCSLAQNQAAMPYAIEPNQLRQRINTIYRSFGQRRQSDIGASESSQGDFDMAAETQPRYSSSGMQESASHKRMMSSGYGQQMEYNEPQHPPHPFSFGYDINDGYGNTHFHKETGDEDGKRTGSYGYMDAFGVRRHVDYVADENGFRATVKTNEPGTANESPADVDWQAEEPPAQTNPGSGSGYGSGGGSNYGGQSSGKSSYGGSTSSMTQYSSPVKRGGSKMIMTTGGNSYGGSSMMTMMNKAKSRRYKMAPRSNAKYGGGAQDNQYSASTAMYTNGFQQYGTSH